MKTTNLVSEPTAKKQKRFSQLPGACLLAALLIIQPGGLLLAQDTHFSQFDMSPLTQNPAQAGASHELAAFVNYREQWQSVASPFKTTAASFDMRLNRKKIKKGFWAAGINFYTDKSGDLPLSTTQVNLTAAYHLHLNAQNTLGAGFQGGFAQQSLGLENIRTGSQYNGSAYDAGLPANETLTNTAHSFADCGAGLLWTYTNSTGASQVNDNQGLRINLGAAVFHPNRPEDSFYADGAQLDIKYVLHGDALICLPAGNLALVPGFQYMVQGPAQELYAGMMLRYKLKQDSKYTGYQKGAALSLGAYYRAGDAIAATMLMEYSNYAIGLSYDVNTSELRSASADRGGFEITLRFLNPNPFLGQKGEGSVPGF